MADDELNRKFDFVVEQLGQTVVGLQMMKEAHEADYQKFDKRMSRLEGAFVGIYNNITENSKQIAEHSQQINSLVKSIDALREESIETREQLDIFIVILEKYISRDQNGNGSSKN